MQNNIWTEHSGEGKRLIFSLFQPLIIFILLFTTGCYQPKSDQSNQPLLCYVNPIIGTGATGAESSLKHGSNTENNAQLLPAVTTPFGMTNWTPQTRNSETKCVSPYYYADSILTGFRGTHWLSGSCTQDYGSFSVMPVTGKLICSPSLRGIKFSHKKETTAPDYYKIELDNYHLTTEMTATKRCGLLRFTFNTNDEAHLIFNPNSDVGEGYVEIFPDKGEIVGYNPVHRIYQGKGQPAGISGYFVLKVNQSFFEYGVYEGVNIYRNTKTIRNKKDLGAYLSFKVNKGDILLAKIGTSFTSIDQARKNMEDEIPAFDFEITQNDLKRNWNKILSKIKVESDDKEELVGFYTAMYHSFQVPRTYNDASGTYPRFAGNSQIDTICSGNYYSDFSLWDTFRALHPLYNLIAPKINQDMMKSLLIMGKTSGWMPIFPMWNSYTSAMIGDHALSVIADAYVKNVISLTEEEYQNLKHNATETPSKYSDYKDGKGRRALPSYLKYGYIPLEDSVKEAFHDNEQTSRTLEYAYDDYCLSQIARKMGKSGDEAYFLKRSKNYQNVFDPSQNCMNGRFKDGKFTTNFDKNKKSSFFTEGTPWQYNWYVPHDVNGLAELMGGREKFNQNLDEFFAEGQYWHGNEPGQQIPFLYTLTGEPWKTQEIVSGILHKEYGNSPGGLSGNDDAGQMSAWYIFAAIGFYPVCPSTPEYVISGPHFKKTTIQLSGGKKLIISAPNYSKENQYINRITWNGKRYDHVTFSHQELVMGGEIEFEMSNSPQKTGK